MRYLTERWWAEFFKTVVCKEEQKVIHDGTKFEKLVSLLLKDMYKSDDIIWEPTQTTHDGSRDFYAHDSKGNPLPLWAECKNYEKSLALKVIAPTIVMVEISEIAEILFFSYSPINNPTKEKLLLYADKARRQVRFYDDENLEKLIFEHRQTLFETYFKGFVFTSEMKLDYTPQIFLKCGKGINVSPDEYRPPKILYAKLNDIIYVGIGIMNTHPTQELIVTLSFAVLNDMDYFEYLGSCAKRNSSEEAVVKGTISPGASAFYTFFFKIQVYKENLKLPEIKVQYQVHDHSSSGEERKDAPSIHCSSLYVTALMGSQYRKLRETFCCNYISQNQLCLCVLEGKSGVGKTRMLYEFISELLKAQYQIIDFTGTNGDTSSLQVIKEIVYNLYNLSEELIVESLKTPQDYENTFGDETLQILRLLQGLTEGKDLVALAEYKNFIFEKILHSKVSILIDNIQFFDDTLISFLRDFLLYAKNVNRESHAVLVLTHNTDYIPPKALLDFKSFISINRESFHHSAESYQIEGLVYDDEPAQALGYLKAIIAVKDESLDTMLNKIVSVAAGNPKYILEIVEYFEQKKILGFENGLLLVRDYEKFSMSVDSIPQNIQAVIDERWRLVQIELLKDLDMVYRILSAVHFWNQCTIELLEKKLSLNVKLLEILEARGILKRDSSGKKVCFEHDLIENYFARKKEFPFLIIKYIAGNHLLETLSPELANWQFLLIQMKSLSYREDILYGAVEQLIEWQEEIPFKWGLAYYKSIICYIKDNFTKSRDKEKLIDGCSVICLKIKNIYGTKAALEQYQSLYRLLERVLGTNRYFNRNYLNFVDGYTENLLHMESSDILDIYKKQICALRLGSKQFHDILGKLYNRIYVYYKNKCPEAEVHKYFHYCDAICRKYHLKELEMLNHFDAGNYFLYAQGETDKLVQHWEIALNIYEKEHFADAFLFVSKKKIELNIIKKQYTNIPAILGASRRYLGECGIGHEQSLFFSKNFYVLGAIYYLLHASLDKELLFYLSKALEYNTLMNDKKLFNLYFLYAKMYYSYGNVCEMILYYEQSLQNLEGYSELYYKKYLKQIILEDLEYKLSCMRLENTLPKEGAFQQDTTLSLWRNISKRSEKDLRSYISSFRTVSNISSSDYKDGYIFL